MINEPMTLHILEWPIQSWEVPS